jgi:hypothetical protein
LCETECPVGHENENKIAVFVIIFWVGRKAAQFVLIRSVLNK